MLSEIREKAAPLMEPVARAFARAGFSPNSLTLIGLLVGSIAALFFAKGEPRLAGLTLLACGVFDVIDGAVARLTGRETAFGGVLDSVIDRYVDFAIFIGITYGIFSEELWRLPSWAWCTLALTGSFMVSYTRARAEAAGSGKLNVGIAERGERMLILAFGGLLGYTLFAVALVAILAHITAIHRIIVTRYRLR
jgi:archaetidylinositol phosphate synthase